MTGKHTPGLQNIPSMLTPTSLESSEPSFGHIPNFIFSNIPYGITQLYCLMLPIFLNEGIWNIHEAALILFAPALPHPILLIAKAATVFISACYPVPVTLTHIPHFGNSSKIYNSVLCLNTNFYTDYSLQSTELILHSIFRHPRARY